MKKLIISILLLLYTNNIYAIGLQGVRSPGDMRCDKDFEAGSINSPPTLRVRTAQKGGQVGIKAPIPGADLDIGQGDRVFSDGIGDILVSDDAEICGTLYVSEDAIISNDVTISGDLRVINSLTATAITITMDSPIIIPTSGSTEISFVGASNAEITSTTQIAITANSVLDLEAGVVINLKTGGSTRVSLLNDGTLAAFNDVVISEDLYVSNDVFVSGDVLVDNTVSADIVRVRIVSADMVGIGRMPIRELDISGDVLVSGDIFVSGDTFLGDGGNTNYLSVNISGDTVFSGNAGLIFGEIFAMNAGEDVEIDGAGEVSKEQVTAFDNNGESHLMLPDHTNDHIIVIKPGHYLCTVSIHLDSQAGSAAKFGFALYKNNGATQFSNIHGHRNMPAGAGGNSGAITMTGILDLVVNDTIEIWAWNEDNAQDITVDDITLSLVQIGG